jgi:hypothetical protein
MHQVGRLQDAVKKFQKATNTLLPVPLCLCFEALFAAVEPRNALLLCERTWPAKWCILTVMNRGSKT